MHNEAVYGRILVEFFNLLVKFFLINCLRQFYQCTFKSDIFASLNFVADIGSACGIVSNDDGCEMRSFQSICDATSYGCLQFVLNGDGGRLSVYNLHSAVGCFIY